MNVLSNSQLIELIIGIAILVCGIAYIVSETIISTLEATKGAIRISLNRCLLYWSSLVVLTIYQ
jgi:hypothetical protein